MVISCESPTGDETSKNIDEETASVVMCRDFRTFTDFGDGTMWLLADSELPQAFRDLKSRHPSAAKQLREAADNMVEGAEHVGTRQFGDPISEFGKLCLNIERPVDDELLDRIGALSEVEVRTQLQDHLGDSVLVDNLLDEAESYGSKGDETLRNLLYELEAVSGEERQRLMQSTLDLLDSADTVDSENLEDR